MDVKKHHSIRNFRLPGVDESSWSVYLWPSCSDSQSLLHMSLITYSSVTKHDVSASVFHGCKASRAGTMVCVAV